MTREEIQNSREYLISKVAVDYYHNHKNTDIVSTFEDACEWADAHPIYNGDIDLEKEIDNYWDKLCDNEFGELLERNSTWFDNIAKYFFELGLKAKKI